MVKSRWKEGESGNPGGRPKRKESFAHWLNKFGAMTPAEVLDEVKLFEEQLGKVKEESIPLVGLVSLRVLVSLLNRPDARLFRTVVDRVDGKLPMTIKTWRDEWVQALKDGTLDPSAVLRELGDELALELFRAAGVERFS